MQERIEELRAHFREAIAAAGANEELEALRIEYLGKKGHIAELMKGCSGEDTVHHHDGRHGELEQKVFLRQG